MSEHGVQFVRDFAALAAPAATATVTYRSTGRCLVIAAPGELERALGCVARLPALGCTVVEPGAAASDGRIDKRLTETGTAVLGVESVDAPQGHLGAFAVHARTGAEASADLAAAAGAEGDRFDLVLDLGPVPATLHRVPPPGYRHVPPDADEAALAEALEHLDALVGEFDKPTYFEYRAERCAHSRSGLAGCTRCLDVCATGAIGSAGDGVRVDPYLCQGCGTCATRCPSGAMVYAWPRPKDAIARTRELLGAADGRISTIVLHEERHAPVVAAALGTDATGAGAGARAATLDLEVEAVAAYGLDWWLAAIAAGARRLVLVDDSAPDSPDRLALEEQGRYLHALLGAAGVPGRALEPVRSEALADALAAPPGLPEGLGGPAFAVSDDKRRTIRDALDTLASRAPGAAPAAVSALPAGAPFGRIRVDVDACTLCMACVSTCPAGSLLDGQDRPALRQIEASCVQCGLCERACPEDAISLETRWVADPVEARRTVTLHEEEPFHCVRCHKPFATRGIIDTMLAKLSGHWMFSDEAALRRLKMCEDCRVKDLFEAEAAGIDVHRGPPGGSAGGPPDEPPSGGRS